MTPQEFKATRNRLGLSQARLGAILGTDPRTVRKWEAEDGTRPPNPIACKVLKWMVNGFDPHAFDDTGAIL